MIEARRRIGLTLDEYVELRQKPSAAEGRTLGTSEGYEPGPLFPMTTLAASSHLRSRGYDVRPPMLDLLVENRVVRLSQPGAWSQADVEVAANHFEQCEIFTPYVMASLALGFHFADFLRALNEASQRESRKYGCSIPADDQYFVLHRIPARTETAPDGRLAKIKPAIVSFTLADDVRERLERGEEV